MDFSIDKMDINYLDIRLKIFLFYNGTTGRKDSGAGRPLMAWAV